MMAAEIPMATFTKCRQDISRLAVGKNSVVATISWSAAMTVNKTPGDDLVHKMTIDAKIEDTWVKAGRSWKLKVRKTIKRTGMIDGMSIH